MTASRRVRRIRSNPAYFGATLMFVEGNFGCGSSREHAPQAIQRRGVQALVGVSFSEIFFGNSVALGMPCASVSPEESRRLIEAVEADPSARFELDLASMRISGEGCVSRSRFRLRPASHL